MKGSGSEHQDLVRIGGIKVRCQDEECTGLDVGGLPVGVGAGVGVTAALDRGMDDVVATAVRRGRPGAVAVLQAAADIIKAALGVRLHARQSECDGGRSENTSARGNAGFAEVSAPSLFEARRKNGSRRRNWRKRERSGMPMSGTALEMADLHQLEAMVTVRRW